MTTGDIDIDHEEVARFVEELATDKPYVIANYLVMIVLESHLRKFVDESPISGLDPITMQLIREIIDRYPDFDTLKAGRFKGAVSKYLISNNYAERYFKFKPFV